jgi:hypothetical protein
MCYFMWNVLFMYNVLCAYLGQWHIWLCNLLMYNTNVSASIYFYAGFWSYDSQCAERHLPHVHWLWKIKKNKPTCILRYKLRHNKIKNKIMSCIKTTYMYQVKIKCKHIYDLISGPPQSVHMWQVLCRNLYLKMHVGLFFLIFIV